MYPPPYKASDGYYTAAAPPPSFGIPAGTAVNQYYTQSVPAPMQVQSQETPTPWSTGLCRCCDDIRNCCLTCLCPCITFGKVAEVVDRGSSSCGTNGALYTLIMCVTCSPCLYSCFYRGKMRRQYSLPKGDCPDCLIHCCCECCALCQEYRELKNRGFDMHMGWQGNMERQARAVTVPPPVAGGMTRED